MIYVICILAALLVVMALSQVADPSRKPEPCEPKSPKFERLHHGVQMSFWVNDFEFVIYTLSNRQQNDGLTIRYTCWPRAIEHSAAIKLIKVA